MFLSRQSAPYRTAVFIGLLAAGCNYLLYPLAAGAQDGESGRRHSLVSRPNPAPGKSAQLHPLLRRSSGISTPQAPLPTSSPVVTSASLQTRLIRRPEIDPLPLSVAQTPVIGANTGAYSASQTGQSTTLMAQTASSARMIMPSALPAQPGLTTASAVSATKSLATTAVPPIAAAASNTGSRYQGTRSAMNVFSNQAFVRLLQPHAPSVVPVSPPPGNQSSKNPQTTSNAPSSSSKPTTGKAVLSWTLGSESDLSGYLVYVGTASGRYNYPGSPFTIGRVNSFTISNLPAGQTYFFALSAYDNTGNMSSLSAEASKSVY